VLDISHSGVMTIRYYGGWAAPNIYFLGFAGVVKFGNIRIGGMSGIHKQRNYYSGKLVDICWGYLVVWRLVVLFNNLCLQDIV
jgi:hypothetical protein